MAKGNEVNPITNPSQDDIKAGLELLAKKKDRERRVKAGEIKGGQVWSELSDEQKAAYRLREKKRRIRNQLWIQEVKAVLAKNKIAEPVISDAAVEKAIAASE
jgi:hypothetical protein